jgi:uncharacterized protein
MTAVSGAGERIQSIDAFRGFALAGIAIAHMMEQYYGAPPPAGLFDDIYASGLDKAAGAFMEIFVRGKFFALFSFLFGVSFFIQMDNGARKGINFRTRFLWRLALLFLIGYTHALLYRGDILTIYAVVGVALVLFFRVRTSVCLGIAAAVFFGLPRFLLFAVNGGDQLFPGGNLDPASPAFLAYAAAVTEGSLADVFRANAWHGLVTKAEFQMNVFGRGYLTFAYFLLGLCIGRLGLFRYPEQHTGTLKRALWVALAVMVLMFVVGAYLFNTLPENSGFDSWQSMFALTAMDLWNLSLATIYLCGFLLWFNRPRGRTMLGKLAPYGRTALSNYVLQTLIGTILLYNFGFGLIGQVSNADMFAIAIVIIAVQIMLSAAWLRHFRFGPLEWVWRSATWFEWQRLRR